MDTNQKKETASAWFKSLRDQFCESFEKIDQAGKFERKSWPHKGSGGGEISIMKGKVFEKVGVNISTVSGEFSEDYRAQVKGTEKSANYWASGISLVAHMQSPKVPAFHFNTRFLVTDDSWFGGGADMTPTFENQKDTDTFHRKMKESCDPTNKNYYKDFKKNCDEYFYLPHRKEPRGIGGIFFDYKKDNFEKNFKFVRDVGVTFGSIFQKIISKKIKKKWTSKDKENQYIKRGRYAEFNLLYDRGTKFGLQTGGNVEGILMSLPPHAKWK